MDGYEITSQEIDGVEVLVQQLHVGAAYSIPSLFSGWRYCNNTGQALEHAKEDIATADAAGRKELHSIDNPTRSGSPEHLLAYRQKIADLEAKVAAAMK